MNKNKGKIYLKKTQGYSVVELIFYIAFFAVLSLVAIEAMLTMARSFKETAIQTSLTQSGMMERITREIRQAYGINSIASSDLVLNTKDDNGADKTVEFQLSGANLKLLENNVLTGNLNPANISVTGLAFTQITTLHGNAIKIVLTIKSTQDSYDRTFDFYDTVVLRGAY